MGWGWETLGIKFIIKSKMYDKYEKAQYTYTHIHIHTHTHTRIYGSADSGDPASEQTTHTLHTHYNSC